MVESSVDLHTTKVDCCRNGCVAITAYREALSACDVCKAARHRANGQPAKQATYWPLLPWLMMMFADAQIGPSMVSGMKEAREAAAAGPPTDLRDWFDGAIFRKLVEQGYFCSNTSVARSISTDGFQAWKQRGFKRWPIIATVLNLDPRSRVRIILQVILGITPGPGQPADLELLLHPIAKELDALAAGVSGVTVAGYPEPQVVSALVKQFTKDMPTRDKLLNAVGHNGERPRNLGTSPRSACTTVTATHNTSHGGAAAAVSADHRRSLGCDRQSARLLPRMFLLAIPGGASHRHPHAPHPFSPLSVRGSDQCGIGQISC